VAKAQTPFPSGLRVPQEWLDGILPRTPGETPDFIKHELLTTIRDFCQDGRAWTRWLRPVVAEALIEFATLEPAIDGTAQPNPDAMVHEVLAAVDTLSGLPLARVDRLGSVNGLPRFSSWSGYSLFEPGVVQFFPIPTTQRVIKFLAVLVPDDLDIPDWMARDHFDTICSGVISRIHMKPGENHDKQLGIWHRKLYLQGRQRARSAAETAFTGSDQPWRFNRFGV
jgi:hypothetical protein